MIPLLVSTIDLKKGFSRLRTNGKMGGDETGGKKDKSGRNERERNGFFSFRGFTVPPPFPLFLFPQAHVCYHDPVIREEKGPRFYPVAAEEAQDQE